MKPTIFTHPSAATPGKTRPAGAAPRHLCLILLGLISLVLLQSEAKAIVYLDITSPELRKINLAVPYFLEKKSPAKIQDSGKKMADLLSRALDFHGFVSIIDPSRYGGRQDTDWQAQGAEFTVLGEYELRSGEVVMELRLVDIHEGHMILGRRYRGAFAKHEFMIRKFCDEVVLKLTGEPGVSLSKIAFVSNASGFKEIYLADALGEEVRQLTRHEYLAVSPRFSPDGDTLAYTSYHRGNPNLYITNLSQGKKTQPISRRPGLNMAPDWSPDGKTMAVTLSKDGNPDLYLMDNNGKILRKLTSGEGLNVSPSWSPDGKQLAFVSDRSGTPQIYVMDIKTLKVKRITYLGNENTTPSWSPKGDRIAYTGLVNGTHHILLIKPDGGTPVQLTQTWGDYESPTWSPDGRQIAFTRKRNNEQKVCAIYINGTGLRTLFDLKGEEFSPQWSPRLTM